jgi:hypothetical protein
MGRTKVFEGKKLQKTWARLIKIYYFVKVYFKINTEEKIYKNINDEKY